MKTVLVTGAAKRLGRAIALDLAAQGWNVAIHYNSSEEDADSAAQAVRAFGVVYGVYNVAWAAGLMAGPVLGGFLLQHAGFTALTIGWSGGLMAASVSWGIWQVKTRK